MLFPEAARVNYKKNPLDKVICQLRFPPILSIDKEIPAQFQDSVREFFSGFYEKEEAILPIPAGIKKELPPELFRQIMPSQTKNYKFSSEDSISTINLTRTFLALTTTNYETWEGFIERLSGPLEALINIYKPAYFSRIGLRYVDIIKRSVLKLEDINWNELLQPFVLGLLGSDKVSSDIETFETKYQIPLEDGESMVRIVMSLVDWEKANQNGIEECFMIDTDFYAKKTEITNVMGKLEYFHIQASRLIQWLITKKLHDAMEPKSL